MARQSVLTSVEPQRQEDHATSMWQTDAASLERIALAPLKAWCHAARTGSDPADRSFLEGTAACRWRL